MIIVSSSLFAEGSHRSTQEHLKAGICQSADTSLCRYIRDPLIDAAFKQSHVLLCLKLYLNISYMLLDKLLSVMLSFKIQTSLVMLLFYCLCKQKVILFVDFIYNTW